MEVIHPEDGDGLLIPAGIRQMIGFSSGLEPGRSGTGLEHDGKRNARSNEGSHDAFVKG